MSKLFLIGLVLFSSAFMSLCDSDHNNPVAQDVQKEREDYRLPPDQFVPLEVTPEMIDHDSLVYPEWDPQWGSAAVVLVKVLVGREGLVLGALIGISCGSSVLDNAALANAVTYTFNPGIQNGRPVAVWVIFKIEFKRPDSPR